MTPGPELSHLGGWDRSDVNTQVEYELTKADFERIAAVLREDSGIQLNEGKSALVYSRLAKRLRLLGLESFKSYCDLISSHEGASERRHMLTSLTTNVTAFFREPHHFEHLETFLKTQHVDRTRRGGRLRIWSAGCSSGEEPFSIAAILLKVLPDAMRLDAKILATDIDTKILARGKSATYPMDGATQIPPQYRQNLFEANPDGDAVFSQSVRSLISFRELNLMAQRWPMKGQFDVIFCRNVAIYFSDQDQQTLWKRFGQKLAPGGRLYIGHSERISDPDFLSDGLTIYKKRDEAR